MAYTTGATVLDRVRKIWREVTSAEMPEGAATFADDYAAEAYDLICEKLLGRGYTQAQLDAWPRRVHYNREIAVYQTLIKLGTYTPDAIAAWQEELERLIAELDTVEIVVSGDVVAPTSTGQVGYGTYNTANDQFPLPEKW